MDFISGYAQFTQAIVNVTGASRPMLHMHAGMALYLFGLVISRERRGSAFALLLVLQAEVFNEVMDKLYSGSWRWPDTTADFVLTLFWPVCCFLVSRYCRARWARSAAMPRQTSRELPSEVGHAVQSAPAGPQLVAIRLRSTMSRNAVAQQQPGFRRSA